MRVPKVRLGRRVLLGLPALRAPLAPQGLRVLQVPPDLQGQKATQAPRQTQNRKFLSEAASVSGVDV